LFAFDDYFPAVATTDLLARVADVLCAKPSVHTHAFRVRVGFRVRV